MERFKINMLNAKTAEILLYGDIHKYEISSMLVINEIKKLDEKVTNIDVRINSGGGDVFEGIAIYQALKRTNKKITVHVDALSASIASIIMMAGDDIVMGEGSQVMIHNPWTFTAGDSAKLLQMVERLDAIKNELVSIYSNKMNVSKNEISRMMDDETWFNADEAIEFALATDKIEASEGFAISASINKCDWILRKEKLNAQPKIKSMLSETLNKYNNVLARSKNAAK